MNDKQNPPPSKDSLTGSGSSPDVVDENDETGKTDTQGDAVDWWKDGKPTPALGLIAVATAQDEQQNRENIEKASDERQSAVDDKKTKDDDEKQLGLAPLTTAPAQDESRESTDDDNRQLAEDRKTKEEAKKQLLLAPATTVPRQDEIRESTEDDRSQLVEDRKTKEDAKQQQLALAPAMSVSPQDELSAQDGHSVVSRGTFSQAKMMGGEIQDDVQSKAVTVPPSLGEDDENDVEQARGEVPGTPEGDGGDDALAVAVPVGSGPLGIAERFDPNASSWLFRKRRLRLFSVMGAIALVAITVGVTLGVVLSKDDQAAPVPPTWWQPYLKELSKVSEDVSTPGTSPYLAAEWIIEEDPRKLTVDAENLIQRYVLALLYYSTTDNRKSSWTSCNPPGAGEGSNCTFQMFEYVNSDGTYEYSQKDGYVRWLSSEDECNWAGITCDPEDHLVDEIRLEGHNISGHFPSGLDHLSSLEHLHLPFNNLGGTFPSEAIGKIKLLRALDLKYNQLSGTVLDSFWGESRSLQSLNLAGNQLSGTLSSMIGGLRSLQSLFLFENEFNGSIPLELTQLTDLEKVRMHKCKFDGTLPTEIGKLLKLIRLRLEGNDLVGTIPSEVGLLTNCVDLRLAGTVERSMRLNGRIPEELYNMTALGILALLGNELSGTLSTRIGNLRFLRELVISENNLVGTVPVELANLTNLRGAWLNYNLFTGSIPIELCANVGPGKLEFLNADCWPEDDPAQNCSCCSACCDRELLECHILS